MDLNNHQSNPILSPAHIEDIREAAAKMSGANRRAYQAKITLKYCDGSARKSESIFGWNRNTVETGLGELRTGLQCIGMQSAKSGRKRWEETHPQAATILRRLIESYIRRNRKKIKSASYFPPFSAQEALQQLREKGVPAEDLPAASTMSGILHRLGCPQWRNMKKKGKNNLHK